MRAEDEDEDKIRSTSDSVPNRLAGPRDRRTRCRAGQEEETLGDAGARG